jgi:D-3-phosphoglycerate dehydrogenase
MSDIQRYEDIIPLVSTCDYIVISVSYDSGSHGFFSKDLIKRMKKDSFLINTSRGEVLDECALLDALQSNHIAGAALDVLCDELKPGFLRDNALIQYAKLNANLLITPHIGGFTKESLAMTEEFVAKKIIKTVKSHEYNA